MNSDPLDELLEAYARRNPPMPSGRLRSEVWAAIDQRRNRPFWAGFLPVLAWRELFAEPRLVAASVAVALIVGLLPAAASRGTIHSQMARSSLHLDVFTAEANPILASAAR